MFNMKRFDGEPNTIEKRRNGVGFVSVVRAEGLYFFFYYFSDAHVYYTQNYYSCNPFPACAWGNAHGRFAVST